jgi:protein arginine kinase
MLRLGADLDIDPSTVTAASSICSSLEIQPAHLQIQAGRELSPEERDVLRAEITRQRLQSINGPT